MSFKIVLSQKSGCNFINICPEHWETDGFLSFPKHLEGTQEYEALVSNPLSVPHKTWKKIPCEVRMTNIKTYQKALKAEEMFLNFEEEELFACIRDDAAEEEEKPEIETHISDQENIDEIIEETWNSDFESEVNFNELEHEKTCKNTDLRKVIQMQDEFNRTLKTKLSQLHTKADALITVLRKAAQPDFKCRKRRLSSRFTFPLSDIQELKRFEIYLSSDDNKDAMIEELSNIIGTEGDKTLSEVGIYLIKNLFENRLLSNYNWRGISGSNRLPFCYFYRIRELVFDLLQRAVTSLTKEKSDTFLRDTILKPARQKLRNKKIAPEAAAILNEPKFIMEKIPKILPDFTESDDDFLVKKEFVDQE